MQTLAFRFRRDVDIFIFFVLSCRIQINLLKTVEKVSTPTLTLTLTKNKKKVEIMSRIRAVRGTRDMMGPELQHLGYIEQSMAEICITHGFIPVSKTKTKKKAWNEKS